MTAPLARLPAPSALRWEPWAGSIIPAWRAEVEAVGFTGVVVALLSLNLQGRAEVVLRVEDAGEVIVVLGSVRARGVKDPASARAWAEGVISVQMDSLGARTSGSLASGAAEAQKGRVGKVSDMVPEPAPQGARLERDAATRQPEGPADRRGRPRPRYLVYI